MVGGRQRDRRKSKLNRYVGERVFVDFILGDSSERENIFLTGSLNYSLNEGYFLEESGIPLPISSTVPDGYKRHLTVDVPEGSPLENQLIKRGVIS